QSHAVGKQLSCRVAVFHQYPPAAAKILPVKLNRQQAAPVWQQGIAGLIVENLGSAGDFALLNRELQAPLAARAAKRRDRQPGLRVAVLQPDGRRLKPPAEIHRATEPPRD